MAKDYKSLTNDVSKYTRELRKLTPDAMGAFSSLAQAATKAGVIDAKTKELVALAIAVATRCDACIGFHVKALHALEASREEVSEILMMNVYLGGGPSLMYAADALRAFDQFAQ